MSMLLSTQDVIGLGHSQMFGHCVTQTGKYFSYNTGVDTETISPGEEVQLYDSYAI